VLTPEQIAPLRSATPEALASLPDEVRLICTLYNFLRPPGERLLGCGERRLSGDFPQTPEFERDRAALLHSYDERIGLIDRAIARIRDELVALGQWDDTLLILTSDHGEAFFEHGYVPFDEVLRIPLVVSYPKLLREGPVREVSGLTWHLDLAPSILRLAGIDPPPSLSGIDLVPMMLGSALISERQTLFPIVLDLPMDPGEPRLVVLRGPLKYVEGHERFGDAGGFLFDRRADPHERRNLRELRPRQFQSLVAASHRFRARLAPTAIPLIEPLEFSEQERRRLRALGYLD